MSLNGFLDLGTAISGVTVVTPPAGTNYAAQPISFELLVGGVQVSNVNCVFGPVSGSWGTLTVFGITNGSGTSYVAPGTLQQPFTPLNGELVIVSPGAITLEVGTQFPTTPTLWGSNQAAWMASLPLSPSGVPYYGWWNNGGLAQQVLP